MAKKLGLVLSGGGARGAYQAGLLSAINEISEKSGVPFQIDFLSGVSAGAINAASIASHCDDLTIGTQNLTKLWSELSFEKVLNLEALTMSKIGIQWMRELSLGGITGTTPGRALLDTSPLRNLLHENIKFEKIEKNISQDLLTALCITSIDYAKSATTTFVQGKNNLPSWDKGRKKSERTIISSDHIMASAAIPLLFPPVKVDDRFFGDGAVRNHAPCSPVIYLGAEKLLIIGVRLQSSMTEYDERGLQLTEAPSVARVLNTILHSTMMDAIEQDVELLRRYNEYAKALTPQNNHGVQLRPLDHLFISPSADIGKMAAQKSQKLPRMIRYLLKGLGSLQDASEIISYLMFDPTFCNDLVEIGYKDGINQKEEIIQFLKK